MKTIVTLAACSLALFSCKSKDTAGNATAKPYTQDTCLISGEKLGTMGTPYEIVYEGQQIKFCCSHCEPDFRKEPAKYLSQLK